jgi:NAD+ synthase (glutamine-hydrolysing)
MMMNIVVKFFQDDMGMTYEELSYYGKLRKIQGCGPYSMFCKLVHTWKERFSPREVSRSVCFLLAYNQNDARLVSGLKPRCHCA